MKGGLKKAGGAILICELAGAVGAVFTRPAIPVWYAGLVKPGWVVPNWVFGPVWIGLYALMGAAVYLVWNLGIKRVKVREAVAIFGLQLVFNVLWSGVFFGLRSIWGGVVVMGALLALVGWTIIRFEKISRTAAWLMVPYMLWLIFAAMLNVMIGVMNAPQLVCIC